MSTESIGTARLDLIVGTEQMEVAIERAKSRYAGMSESAQTELGKLNAAEKRRVDTLIRQADTVGFNRQQQIAYNAALKTQGPLLDDITRRLTAQQAAAKGAAHEVGQVGKSQKELAFAMRGVPAQITDIVTSLQGGQNPLTVFLQQGGQLRDMFGGLGPAARALSSSLLAMVTPTTLAAAAAAALIAAWHQGESEGTRFNQALAMTGAISGGTADGLRDLSAILGDGATTTHQAAAALAEVVESGKFTASQFRLVAESAIFMERATGQATEETVKQFAKLAEEPVTAVAKLNEEMHFLTAAQYENIKALYDQGNAQGAAQAAMEAYADAVKRRTQDVLENLGTLEKGWYYLKIGASAAWDAMLGVGRDPSGAQKFQETFRQLQEVENPSSVFSFAQLGPKGSEARQKRAEELRAELQRLQDDNIRSQREASRAASAQQANDFSIQLNRELDQYASKEQRRVREIQRSRKAANDAIAKATAAGDTVLAERIAADQKKLEAGIEAKYADKNRPKKTRTATDPTDSIVARLKQQIAVNQEQAKSEDALTASERLHIQVQQQLDRISGKVTAGRRAEIEALLKQSDVSGKAAEAAKSEAKAKEQLVRLNAQLSLAEENQKRGIQVDLSELGHGGDIADMLHRQLEIHRQYEDGLKGLRDRDVAENSQAWQMQEQALRESRDRMLETEREYQRKRAEVMGNPMVGITRANEAYITSARDVAGQVESIWGNAIQGMEDVMVDFLVTGKGDWNSFLTSLAADISRFMVKQAVLKFLEAFSNKGQGASSSGSGGFWTQIVSAIGGMFTANAKGGVYSSPGLSDYSGKVVSTPTVFAFARGAGLMGEAGPEAIMPLKRAQSGALGVVATGLSSDVKVEVINNGQPATATASSMRQPDGSELIRVVLDAVAGDISGGGKTASAMRGRFGLREPV